MRTDSSEVVRLLRRTREALWQAREGIVSPDIARYEIGVAVAEFDGQTEFDFSKDKEA